MTLRALVIGVSLLSGCKGEAPEPATLSVYAASSLTEAFRELERGFEAAEPGVDLVPTFAGSQVLRLQIEQGAPADVFASANEAHMAALSESGDVDDNEVFAQNELVVIVPPDNPAGVEGFADLTRADRIVVGTENVPVGAYTRALLARVGGGFAEHVTSRVVSEESNVRLVRAKVELGEADAAIVYRTDAAASDRVSVVSIPADLHVRASYHLGRVARTERPELARRFMRYVASGEGRRILSRHGFVVE